MNRIKITAMSTLCVDVFDSTDIIRPGGEALNFAGNATLLDYMDVSLIGAIGNDEYGKVILNSIKDLPIDTSCIYTYDSPTASHVTYLTPDGDRYYKDDSWSSGALALFKKLHNADISKIITSDVVFLDVYSQFFYDVLKLRKENHFKLAVDFNTVNNAELFTTVAPYVDFFMISCQSGADSILQALSKQYDGLFNITFAENGSKTYFHGTEYTVSAVNVDNVVDTTGAGDSYHAGFVCSYIHDGDIIEAMNLGSKFAAKVISKFGGF